MNAQWPRQLTDEAVIARIQTGDAELFEIIIRRYNQRLYRAAMAIVHDADEAEDILQEAYLSAYTHLDQFAGRAKFSTWLTRIAVNEALARLAKRTRTATVTLRDWEDNELPTPQPDPDHRLIHQSLKGFLETAVGKLSPPYRSVFVLREIEKLNTAETAAALGITEDNVKVRLHRARAYLREEIHLQTGITSWTLYEFMGSRCDSVVAAVMGRVQRQSHA